MDSKSTRNFEGLVIAVFVGSGVCRHTYEYHLAHMRRTKKLSITQALEQDALLVRNHDNLHEERVVGGELEVQQPVLFCNTAPPWIRTRTRTNTNRRTNTNPNDTEANEAGRRGVRVCSANGTCENQGAWVAKPLTKSEALMGGAHSGNV
jgi:hypothetical protein